MTGVSKLNIQEFFKRLGNRYPKQVELHLLGGSALILLGSSRDTLDIDYVGDDIQKDEFQIIVEETAGELELETEAVPIDRFIPLPEGSEQRKIHVGQFGNVNVYITDPYTIALSKLDRGMDADLEDIVFLIQRNHVNLKELETVLQSLISKAGKFDFHPDIFAHMKELKSRLK
jgi:hypothetical protein